jgi:hypothetical protein
LHKPNSWLDEKPSKTEGLDKDIAELVDSDKSGAPHQTTTVLSYGEEERRWLRRSLSGRSRM